MKRKIIIGTIALLLLAGAYIGYKVMGPAVSTANSKFIYVTDNDNAATVTEKLISQKFINSKAWFDRVAGWLKYKNVKPGRYELTDGMSLVKLVKMLRAGNQLPVKIVIIKERTKELFSGKMGKKFDTACDSLQMITFLNNNDSLKKYGVDTNTVMAVVMPYTYSINWNSSPDKIVAQFHTAYKKFWTNERKIKADSLHLTPIQVSILASIVEEETSRKADKFNVASTYLNRLEKGMRLEADPTVKFITRNFQLGRIQGIHLKLESPYNTYINTGLPPGPICTPSIESITAVLDAPKTEYIFFVASHKFDGSTVFTTNYTDHLKYVKLFQNEQRRRADSIQRLKKAS
jgi:UPF0755 protein